MQWTLCSERGDAEHVFAEFRGGLHPAVLIDSSGQVLDFYGAEIIKFLLSCWAEHKMKDYAARGLTKIPRAGRMEMSEPVTDEYFVADDVAMVALAWWQWKQEINKNNGAIFKQTPKQ
jgi:hypothetical protein